MRADELLIASVLVEYWVEGRVSQSIAKGAVKHHQAQNRNHDSGYDETFSPARARRPASIDRTIHRSTGARETDSPHVPCEFRHPTQFVGEGEFARSRFVTVRRIRPSEPVGKVGAEERHVDGCGQEYPIAASEHVVFSGASE